MDKNKCWLEENGKLHLCDHSLHYRKTTKRCEYLSGKHKEDWCSKLIEASKTSVQDDDVVKPVLKVSFLKGRSKAKIGKPKRKK